MRSSLQQQGVPILIALGLLAGSVPWGHCYVTVHVCQERLHVWPDIKSGEATAKGRSYSAQEISESALNVAGCRTLPSRNPHTSRATSTGAAAECIESVVSHHACGYVAVRCVLIPQRHWRATKRQGDEGAVALGPTGNGKKKQRGAGPGTGIPSIQ